MEDKKGSIIGYLFLILIILGLAGYIVYDKDFLHLKKEIDKEETSKSKNTKINYATIYQIGNTLKNFDVAFNEVGTTFTAYIYNEKKIIASKFDKDAALYAALRNEVVPSNVRMAIANGTVKNNYEKMFGTYLNYEPEIIQAGNNYNIYYDAASNSYYHTIPVNTNLYVPKYFTVTTKTEAVDDDIIVTRKIFYAEYLNNGATIYKDATKKDQVAQLDLRDGIINEQEVMDKYSSKLSTFKYTFKRRKDTDYSFYSIKKIK